VIGIADGRGWSQNAAFAGSEIDAVGRRGIMRRMGKVGGAKGLYALNAQADVCARNRNVLSGRPGARLRNCAIYAINAVEFFRRGVVL
jgi:hypothetical protein